MYEIYFEFYCLFIISTVLEVHKGYKLYYFWVLNFDTKYVQNTFIRVM